MVDRVVDDVLAGALLADAEEPDDRRDAGERARDVALEPLERVLLDDQRQGGDGVPERHAATLTGLVAAPPAAPGAPEEQADAKQAARGQPGG